MNATKPDLESSPKLSCRDCGSASFHLVGPDTVRCAQCKEVVTGWHHFFADNRLLHLQKAIDLIREAQAL